MDARSKNVVDKRRLLELDEQRKRAEEDKMTAIRALEQRSMEFMKEKEEKKILRAAAKKAVSVPVPAPTSHSPINDENVPSPTNSQLIVMNEIIIDNTQLAEVDVVKPKKRGGAKQPSVMKRLRSTLRLI